MALGAGSYVRFESKLTPGKWFVGRVSLMFDERAVVRDPNGRWGPDVISVSRLEYIPPKGKFR